MARVLIKEIKDARKNYIINGDMRVSQRASSFTNPTNAYTLDRWLWGSSTAVGNISQDSDVPTQAQVIAATGVAYTFQNSLKVAITSPNASITSGQQYVLSQRIEGYTFSNFAQKQFTISFWMKAPVTGIYCVSLGANGGDHDYAKEFTVIAANTWEYKTITIDPTPVSGTWVYNSGIGLIFRIALAAGSSFVIPNATWGSTNKMITSNQVNGVGVSGNVFFTGIMINEGFIAAPFHTFGGDSFQGDLAACQRYAWRANYASSSTTIHGLAFDGTNVLGTIYFPTTMRANPTMPTVTSVGQVRAGNSDITPTSLTFVASNPFSAYIEMSKTSSFSQTVSYQMYSFDITFDAEL